MAEAEATVAELKEEAMNRSVELAAPIEAHSAEYVAELKEEVRGLGKQLQAANKKAQGGSKQARAAHASRPTLAGCYVRGSNPQQKAEIFGKEEEGEGW